MKFQVKTIEVKFSRGSFEEWANTHEEQSPDDIERWETAYYEQISSKIKEIFPNATIEVDEGYDQLMNTKYYIELAKTEADEDYEGEEWQSLIFEDRVKLEIDRILDHVSETGKFWEA